MSHNKITEKSPPGDYKYANLLERNLAKQESIVDRSIQSLPDLTYGSAYDISQITKLQQHEHHRHDPKGQEVNGSTKVNGHDLQPVPLDGGYGWVVVIAAFCNFNLVGAHMMGFSLIYPSITADFESTYGTVGWVGSVSQAIAFLPGFIYATLVVRTGSRTTCIIGSLLSSIGSILSSQAPNVYTLYLTYGVLSGSGIGMMYISNVVIVQQYFDKQRGRAVGIAMAGLSFGTVTGSIVLSLGIHYYGWRGALLIVGAFNLHGVVFGLLQRPLSASQPKRHHPTPTDPSRKPLMLSSIRQEELKVNSASETNVAELHKHNGFQSLDPTKGKYTNGQNSQLTNSDNHLHTNTGDIYISKDGFEVRVDNNETAQKSNPIDNSAEIEVEKESTIAAWLKDMFDFSLLKDARFLCFCIGTFLLNIGMMCFYMHSPSRALHYGVPSELLGLIPPTTGMFTMSSRIIFGFVSDCKCVDRSLQYAIGILVGAVVEITFVFSTTLPTILIHCMMFGFANGIFLTVQSTVLVDMLSIEKIAKSQAILGFFIGTACLIATPFAGFLYDVTNDYNIPFLVSGSIQFLSAALLLVVFLRLKFVKKQKQTLS